MFGNYGEFMDLHQSHVYAGARAGAGAEQEEELDEDEEVGAACAELVN
jgi:hypothetical protein